MSRPLDYQSPPPPAPKDATPSARSALGTGVCAVILAMFLLIPAVVFVLGTSQHFGSRRSILSGGGECVIAGYCLVCFFAILCAAASLRRSDRTAGTIALAVVAILVSLACAIGFLLIIDLLLGPTIS